MEAVDMNAAFWREKRVLITGHTGFKGGWLSLWLSALGAEVHGVSLEPEKTENFFDIVGLDKKIASSTLANICHLDAVIDVFTKCAPELVFHLAAQPIVRKSYRDPVGTFNTNVMGTVNVLEAARQNLSVKAFVNVTSDKCYENKGWSWAYREDDQLGGHDPYSNSKACSELVADCYRKSFSDESGMLIASARAGNVIGGGDWGDDRLVPDFYRAAQCGQMLSIRSPKSIRPWQHVLEPLSGYLLLAERLCLEGEKYAHAWNFGPNISEPRDVEWVVNKFSNLTQFFNVSVSKRADLHESQVLMVDNSKARLELDWKPRWCLDKTIEATANWYSAWNSSQDMFAFSLDQIQKFKKSVTD